jgi:hypothetical protein
MEALIEHLRDQELPYRMLLGEENRVKHVFITLPECIKHLQNNYDVILIDNTYRTNRFNMPLFDVIGLYSSNTINIIYWLIYIFRC